MYSIDLSVTEQRCSQDKRGDQQEPLLVCVACQETLYISKASKHFHAEWMMGAFVIGVHFRLTKVSSSSSHDHSIL